MMTELRATRYAVTLVALNAALGLIRLLESANRQQSDAFHYAKQVMPLRGWGILFLAVAVAMVIARNHATCTRAAAAFGLGVWVFWGALLASAAGFDGRSSFAGAILYIAGAVRHLQVARDH